MRPQIKITVSDEGEIQIETVGFKGKSCVEETEFLKKVLGKETFKQLTPAYYVNETQEKKKYLPLCG